MYLFNRSISVNVRLEDKETLRVEGFFLDTHHELCLSIKVDLESNTITSADGELRRVPHTDCAYTKDRIKKLIGTNLNRSVRRQIQAAVGLKEGCTHLTDLALECVKALMQARYQLMNLTMREEEVNKMVEQFLEGSCQHYKAI
ncbi:DUF2889 domain-containing protein [Desulfosporosinus sp. I2]|uniref:DUF2889 domain-containing protein n=1 Tax=Desulfosporosinus sp. I2 TaxID=1617025 RepID=UPI0005F0328B|nr:DUF2889 domain-containing protein [Desulfosporosinus sp. I2]